MRFSRMKVPAKCSIESLEIKDRRMGAIWSAIPSDRRWFLILKQENDLRSLIGMPKLDKNKMRERRGIGKKVNGGVGISLRLEEEKVIRVRWEKFGSEGYTAKRLRDLLSKFGGVKDLILGSGCLALVLMETREAAVAATGAVIGDLSNPLRVSHFQPVAPKRMVAPTAEKSDEPDRINNLVGVGFRTFEDDVLKKVAQAGQKQKLDRQSA
ncbi:hypothetical protein ABKV19_014525 [Rosa sericea]